MNPFAKKIAFSMGLVLFAIAVKKDLKRSDKGKRQNTWRENNTLLIWHLALLCIGPPATGRIISVTAITAAGRLRLVTSAICT